MPREKPDRLPRQATFDFDVPMSAAHQAVNTPEANAVATPVTMGITQQATVIWLVDRHRARHHEVVRKLLAETGVFRVR
jgi:hypothetical protein